MSETESLEERFAWYSRKLAPGMTAAERESWLEPGERVFIDTRIVPTENHGKNTYAPGFCLEV